MSVATKVVAAIGGILITLCLAMVVVLAGLVQFTAEDNLRPVLVEAVMEQMPNLTQQELAQQKDFILQRYCPIGTQTGTIPANESGAGIDITIDCSELRTTENLRLFLANMMFNTIYYKDYGCDPFGCLQAGKPEALASASSNAWFNNALTFVLIGAIVGIVLVIVGIRQPSAILKSVGISIVFAGLGAPLMWIAQTTVPAAMPPAMSAHITNLFTSLITNFAILLVIGIILAMAGFIIGRKAGRKKKRK
jgi:hypothetical protein